MPQVFLIPLRPRHLSAPPSGVGPATSRLFQATSMGPANSTWWCTRACLCRCFYTPTPSSCGAACCASRSTFPMQRQRLRCCRQGLHCSRLLKGYRAGLSFWLKTKAYASSCHNQHRRRRRRRHPLLRRLWFKITRHIAKLPHLLHRLPLRTNPPFHHQSSEQRPSNQALVQSGSSKALFRSCATSFPTTPASSMSAHPP